MSSDRSALAKGLSQVEAGGLLDALDAIGLAWWTKDSAGRYLRLSLAGQVLLGIDEAQALGLTDAELMPAASAAALASEHAVSASAPQAVEHAVELNGVARHLACAVVRLVPAAPGDAVWLGAWLDRSELREREAEWRSVLAQLETQQDEQRLLRSELDSRAQAAAPVRLVRREQFEDKLGREIDLSLREHREFAVVYIGIDRSADGGAERGAREAVLAAFDGILRSNTRAMDAPSRLDGERFALLLSGVGLATAHARMEGLRRQCATQLIAHDGAVLRFTVSMGVASYPHTSQTQAGLQRAAQSALEQAQQRGGNHVALASIAFGGPTLSGADLS
jgi:diguanylate cyclase (GGDEF)-like protein